MLQPLQEEVLTTLGQHLVFVRGSPIPKFEYQFGQGRIGR